MSKANEDVVIKRNKRFLFSVIMIVLSFLAILLTRDKDAIFAVAWMMVVFVISFGMRPYLFTRSLDYFDGGFALSFGLGTALSFFLTWFISATSSLSFGFPLAAMSLLVLIVVINVLSAKSVTTYKWSSDNIEKMLFGFAIFACLFAFAFWMKGYKPIIDSTTEQYMDYGFMNAIYRQQAVPFEDFWYAGEKINYYYFGQAVAVFLCRLSFVKPSIGYNLTLCTLFATFSLMCASLAGAVVGAFPKTGKVGKCAGSILGALACSFAGNGHYLVYGLFKPLFQKIAGREVEYYWFPSSTVWIGENPDLPDKGKNEFPAYSFVLGDLHAHVCNIIFVLPLLAILFDYAISTQNAKGASTQPARKISLKSMLKELLSPYVLMISVMLGMFFGVNYWDFPIYFVISGTIILFTDLLRDRKKWFSVVMVLIKGLIIGSLSTLIMLPFLIPFNKMSSGFNFCSNHTQLYKFLTLWGLPSLIAILLIIQMFAKHGEEKKKLSALELSLIGFALCAIGLTLVPEVVYVRDIYEEGYARFNTMFKLTYQAFILLGLCIAVCGGLFFNEWATFGKKKIRYIVGSVFVACFTLLLSGFSANAAGEWFCCFDEGVTREGIDGTAFLTDDTYGGAVDYLLNEEERNITVIEAAGNSYEPDNKISVFAGVNAIRGWYVHEWLWRDSVDIVEERGRQIQAFYENGNVDYCAELINNYGIDYIVAGASESKYYNINIEGFKDLSEPVYISDMGDCVLWKINESAVADHIAGIAE